MKALLDTNILINRETAFPISKDIGKLFGCIDSLKYDKVVHPRSLDEIKSYKDEKVVKAFEIKLQSYKVLPVLSQDDNNIAKLRVADRSRNDEIDTDLLREVYNSRVDVLISEDRGIHRKARSLGIPDAVFTIEEFIDYAAAQNPQLITYRVPTVSLDYFANIDLNDPFFESFKRDYAEFTTWFKTKYDSKAYICRSNDNRIEAFLYMKREDVSESYADIAPSFTKARRIKIGTFKVSLNGVRIGEKFLKLIFDFAITTGDDEIYVTLFNRTEEQKRLISLLEEWGFVRHGIKTTSNGEEQVYIRALKVPNSDPKAEFPYIKKTSQKWIVPIKPEYHTELLPESILRNENPNNYKELLPHRNSIQKAYISWAYDRTIRPGDAVVFYRTKDTSPGHYSSVVTTIGIVDEVFIRFRSVEEFVRISRKLSVFNDTKLAQLWDSNSYSKPFVVKFLNAITLPRKINLSTLKEIQAVSDAPRGFEKLSEQQFMKIVEHSQLTPAIII